MRLTAMILAASLAAAPVAADDGTVKEGFDLLSEGTRLLLEGLLGEMEPALRDLQGAFDDLNAYHAPEILPNGDIIIRRKTPVELDPPEEGEIDL